jgi:VanZ family protein
MGVLWCLAWPGIALLLLSPLPFAMVSRSDLLGHFLLFGGMTLLTVSFARTPLQILILATLTVAYGVSLDLAQGYVPSRTFDLADALANLMGGLAGCLGALLLLRLWLQPASSADDGDFRARSS